MAQESKRFLLFSIFLISFCLLLLEIFMTRIFSVALYYHFAFMAISIALLGLGMSGMVIYLFPNFFSKENSFKLIVWSSILFSLFILLVLFLIKYLKVELQISLSSSVNLILLFSILIIPFFCGGLIISLILTHFSEKISKLYFFDLLGASLGSIGVILLLTYFGGPNGLIFISLLGLLNAFVLSWHLKFKKLFMLTLILLIIVLSLLAVGLIYNPFTLEFTRGAEDAQKEFSAWNSFSRVDLFGNEEGKIINIDSDASTSVIRIDNDISEVSSLTDEIYALPYHLRQDANVLIIGTGGGKDVINALLFNNTVVGVEINDIIVNDLMKDKLVNFTGGIYLRDDVNIVVDEGRSYVRRSKDKYEVIQMSLVDTFAATAAGAFVMSENNLYTIEAVIDYFNHLNDDGIFSSTRYTYETPQEALRLVGIALEALDELGVENPENHFLIVRSEFYYPEGTDIPRTPIEGTANIMIKKSEFKTWEIDKILAQSEKQGYEVLYNPLEIKDNLFNKLIRTDDRVTFYENYPLNIAPLRDDKPFFFYTLKFKDTFNFFKLYSGEFERDLMMKTNLGLFILLVTFFLTLGLSGVFILGPLLFMKSRDFKENKSNKLIILLYFLGIGSGFLLIEIVLLQKFILFLGHPVYSLGVTLFSILLFSGIGSFLTNFTFRSQINKSIIKSLIGLFVLILAYLFLLPIIFNKFIGETLFLRACISVLILMPLGLLLGRFFPLGIKKIDQSYHSMIPWAWGVNGAASVVSSVVAILLAINLGFNVTLVIGLLFYLLTLGLVFKRI